MSVPRETVVFYENSRVRCVLEFWRGRAFLHLRVKQWGIATRRLIADRMIALKRVLKELGYAKLEAFFPDSDPRILKMAQRFGFRAVRHHNGWFLVECENA